VVAIVEAHARQTRRLGGAAKAVREPRRVERFAVAAGIVEAVVVR
jgi:hypothetical protein